MKRPSVAPLLPSVLVVCLSACGARAEPTAIEPIDPAPAVDQTPPPPPPITIGEERCEGLVGGCGGWIGCVHVRTDANDAERFVGVAENAGAFYVATHDGNVICTGGSVSGCRPAVVLTDAVVECSAVTAPSTAPFTCRLVSGACEQGPDPSMIPAS